MKNKEKSRHEMSVNGKILLFPFRAVIKATLGKDGFTKLVFGIRDKMLESKSLDLSWLNVEYLKSRMTKDKGG